jgi:feruloyl esterase
MSSRAARRHQPKLPKPAQWGGRGWRQTLALPLRRRAALLDGTASAPAEPIAASAIKGADNGWPSCRRAIAATAPLHIHGPCPSSQPIQLKDGLIQNPGQCPFRAQSLLCKHGQSADCLTAPQVATLHTYLSPLRDASGAIIYPGMSPSDIAGAHGIQAWTTGLTDADFNHLDAPWGADPRRSPSGWNYATQAIKFWLGFGPDAKLDAFGVDSRTGIVRRASLKRLDTVFAEAITRDPRALSTFVRQGRKMIMYHGFSDPAISPFRTTQFYREFARLQGGFARARRSVRLFMAPGMDHCRFGPGPDAFDTLSAIEAWVEHGTAPNSLIATATDPAAVKRSMPLCPFPTAAVYRGAGDVNDALNWSCTANSKLLDKGPHPRSRGPF